MTGGACARCVRDLPANRGETEHITRLSLYNPNIKAAGKLTEGLKSIRSNSSKRAASMILAGRLDEYRIRAQNLLENYISEIGNPDNWIEAQWVQVQYVHFRLSENLSAMTEFFGGALYLLETFLESNKFEDIPIPPVKQISCSRKYKIIDGKEEGGVKGWQRRIPDDRWVIGHAHHNGIIGVKEIITDIIMRWVCWVFLEYPPQKFL